MKSSTVQYLYPRLKNYLKLQANQKELLHKTLKETGAQTERFRIRNTGVLRKIKCVYQTFKHL